MEQKQMIGCRIAPDLKQILESEALEKGMSFSAYLETTLINRAHNSADVQKLQNTIFELESTVSQLKEELNEKMTTTQVQDENELKKLQDALFQKCIENRMVKQELVSLQEQAKRLIQERNTAMSVHNSIIPNWISEPGYQLLKDAVQGMQKKHNHLSFGEILLIAVAIVEYNEGRRFLFINKIDNYLRENKNFLLTYRSIGGNL